MEYTTNSSYNWCIRTAFSNRSTPISAVFNSDLFVWLAIIRQQHSVSGGYLPLHTHTDRWRLNTVQKYCNDDGGEHKAHDASGEISVLAGSRVPWPQRGNTFTKIGHVIIAAIWRANVSLMILTLLNLTVNNWCMRV